MEITERQAELILDMMDSAHGEGLLHEDTEPLYRAILTAYPDINDVASYIWL